MQEIIGVYGLGFVGLTLASTLAKNGLVVIGIDPNQAVIDSLKNGKPQFYESGLEALLGELKINNPIEFVTDSDDLEVNIHIICVGTPINHDGSPNMFYVNEVAGAIAKKLKKQDLVIFRSTLPVGTMRQVVIPILETSGLAIATDFYLAFAPERTVEGNALEELKSLPQIIGGFNQKSVDLTANLFQKITKNIIQVDSLEAAEMVKLMNNTYRDLVFAFANEVANICDRLNINAFKLIKAANQDYPRNPIPSPSPGVGGTCLSKDPYLYTSSYGDYKPVLGEISRRINANGHLYVFEKIKKYCELVDKNINSLKILMIGLAFKGKPQTSDIRDSVGLKLVEILPNRDNLYIKDFVVPKSTIETLGCHYVEDLTAGFAQVDVVLVMNNHELNNKFNLNQALSLINESSLFFDGWDLFNQQQIEAHNIYYATMGYMTDKC
jgi:UDP-N-acetyl-D-mannosaminuronic acid dehydrogenase